MVWRSAYDSNGHSSCLFFHMFFKFTSKFLQGLSQQHKRLRSLADHVPHGYRKRSLFEVLTRNNVPLLRATWFVKVTYLNQVHVCIRMAH